MASSWNLAAAQTSSAVEDVASSGTSLWQSVVDGAAEAMVSGKKSIIDVADDVYDYLPELEDVIDAATTGVEAAGSVLPAIMDTAQAAGEGLMGSVQSVVDEVSSALPEVSDKAPIQGDVPEGTEMTSFGQALQTNGERASKWIKAVTSPVGLNFLNDLAFGKVNTALSNVGITKGESVLSEGGRQFIRKLVIDKGLLEKGSITIDREIYRELQDGISVNQSGGSSASQIVEVLAERNPLSEAKLMLGQFNAYIDENNDIIVEDQFNYNEIMIDGVEYKTEQFEKAIEDGKFTELEVLLDITQSVFKEGLNYEQIRALGFLLGSRDYIDDSRDEGRSFKLNLGQAPAVKTSLRPKARKE